MQHIRLMYGLCTAYMRLKGWTDNQWLPRINGRRGRDFRDKRNRAPVVFASGFRVYRPGVLLALFQPIIRIIFAKIIKDAHLFFPPARSANRIEAPLSY